MSGKRKPKTRTRSADGTPLRPCDFNGTCTTQVKQTPSFFTRCSPHSVLEARELAQEWADDPDLLTVTVQVPDIGYLDHRSVRAEHLLALGEYLKLQQVRAHDEQQEVA